MLGGSIGGIPIMWIMMAQSAASRRKKKTMTTPANLALGDFIIEPDSQQWCRVVKIERIGQRVSVPTKNRENDFIRVGALQKKYKLNQPIYSAREKYKGDLNQISMGNTGHQRMNDADWATHRMTLSFADGKTTERLINKKKELTCIRAPEIFNFDFDQLRELAPNAKRIDEKAKKKPAKKKVAKKTTKKKTTKKKTAAA